MTTTATNPFAQALQNMGVNPFVSAPVQTNGNSNFIPSDNWVNLVEIDFQHIDDKTGDFCCATIAGIPWDKIAEKAQKRIASENSENESYKNLSPLAYKRAKDFEDKTVALPKGKSKITHILFELVTDDQGNCSVKPTSMGIQLLHKKEVKNTVSVETATANGYGQPCPFKIVA